MTPQTTNGYDDDPTDAAPQRRFQPPEVAAGGASSHGHREEVVGQGPGETAGGSPATAASDKKSAKRSAIAAVEVTFDPSEFAQGGVCSNTPPSIPNHIENNNANDPISTGGEDTLEINLYLNHRNPGQLFRQLDRMRDAAETGETGQDEWETGGVRMLCLAGTTSTGGGSKRIAYRWRLQTDTGLVLLLMQRPSAHRTLPNGIVRFGSAPLMRFGTSGCYRQACHWLSAIGADVERNKLGRTDPCVDRVGVQVATFCDPFARGEYVSKVRNATRYRGEIPVGEFETKREPRGFKIGSGAAMLRIYDKLYESRHDNEKRALLQARRWGYLPEAATRVELQLRRTALKRFGVDSFEDWVERRAAILANLSEDWFRFTDGPVDPKHPERSGVLPAWSNVQLAFADWAGDAVEVELVPLARSEANAEHLLKQFYGLGMSALVRTGRKPNSIESFAQESNFLLLSVAEGKDVAADYRRKVLELGLGEM
jgi:hypothetical protein